MNEASPFAVSLESTSGIHDILGARACRPYRGDEMQNQFDPRTTTPGYDPAVSVGVPRAARDAGLRSYMLKVYNYMASGVLLTGIVALLFAPYARDVLISQSGRGLSGLGWLVTLSPLAFVMVMSFGINRIS